MARRVLMRRGMKGRALVAVTIAVSFGTVAHAQSPETPGLHPAAPSEAPAASAAPAEPPAPHAPTPEERAEAKRFFDAGNQAYAAGQYLVAARAYEESYRLAPLAAIRFSVAQAYRLQYYQDHDLGELRRALELYRRYLVEAPHGNRRAHATTLIEAIEGILASQERAQAEQPRSAAVGDAPKAATELLVTSRTSGAQARIDGGDPVELPFSLSVRPGKHRVVVEAPGHLAAESEWLAVDGRLVVAQMELRPRQASLTVRVPDGASVFVDDRRIGEAPLSAPLSLDAGEHVVRVALRGHSPLTRRVTVGRGQATRLVIASLDSTSQRVASCWVMGTAAAMAIAGGITIGLALSAQGRVNDYDRGAGHSDAELRERNDDLALRDRLRAASFALLGGAIAVGGAGGLMFWLDTPGAESRGDARTGVAYRGRF